MKYVFFSTGLFLLLFSACTYEYTKLDPPPNTNTDTIDIPMDSLSFTSDISPIIRQNCLSCHGGFQPPDLSTYEGVKANAVLIKTVTSNRSMPRGGSLTTAEIEKITQWVNQGAKNN